MKLLFLIVTFVAAVSAWEPWIPEPINQPWWTARFNTNVQNSQVNAQNINVIFYGDSIIEGWTSTAVGLWNQHFAPLGAANYGIGGDLVQNLLWRVLNGELNAANLNPRLVVLKIGTNNINLDFDIESDIARGVIETVNDIRRLLPNTRVLVLGILPRTNATWTAFVERINTFISQIDDGNNVRFLNLRDVFFNTATGQLNTELYSGTPPLHLSLLGYTRWQEAMNPLFQQLIN